MTDQELIDYYADLLIIQYKEKPKAYATIQAQVTPIVMEQLPLAVQNAFDLETAIGVQLDVIGKYVGVRRSVFDFTGPINLDDDDFRTLIKIAIIKNTFGSSLSVIQDLLFQFFEGDLLVFDFQNMHMGYFFNSIIGSRQLAEVFVRSNFLPKPMGVELAVLIYAPNINNFFGFRTYELPPYNNHGFNTYSVYDMDAPWINFTYAIYF